MKWTIGMPSYNNYTEVYFTIQSLRLHHDLTDCEIVVVDNFGDPILEKFCMEKGGGLIRYEKLTEIQGVSVAKNRIFEVARGEFVLCMDSHILLQPGTLDGTPWGDDLIQGPCLSNRMNAWGIQWRPIWRRNMWGIWDYVMPQKYYDVLLPNEKEVIDKSIKKGDYRIAELPTEPFEIWAIGAGFFCCRSDSWLGFNPAFRGFGGETGYIQEKYRQAGRKVWCDPRKVWIHFFQNQGRPLPFPIPTRERVRNYLIGFRELGLDVQPIINHFGANMVLQATLMILDEVSGLKTIRSHYNPEKTREEIMKLIAETEKAEPAIIQGDKNGLQP